MSTQVAPHRMHLNTLPFAPLPGIGVAAYCMGGVGAAASAVTLWCVFVGTATVLAMLRYRRNRFHMTFAHEA